MSTTVETVNTPPAAEPPRGAPPAAPNVRYLALRNFAISLTVFNILGYTILGFEQPWLWPFLALATGYTTEIVFEYISAWAERRRVRFRGGGWRGVLEFMLPSHITSLAVNMLLYANNQWWPVMFGVVVAVGQKHVLRAPINGRMRHYMNPSNLGIAVTLLAFGSWVSIAPPYQFTEYANGLFRVLIPLVIATAGTVINAMLTKRVMLIMGWMGGFAIQALIRHWIWDVALVSALGVMAGVAFVLFTNYMITDPGTTPHGGRAQFIFGSSVATVYGVLMVANVVYTLFFATAIVCGLRGLGWWVAHWRAERRNRQYESVPAPGAANAIA
ncbi:MULTISPECIES: enediyne biosynthesis protein [Actinomadura]|uniref:Enediyne biosynthesis protein n=1 Tax=Actinomadura litoris TaxID=2678616 RepID=A0A7K1L938_9ACTN|nr:MULTISPECIES: enediyne biosynthesis protein [Actinomadura]MBT2212853.1 enediyne biosynthesis protein [Actinomadura sp. NEAU-AAG7]MUN40952.1 enediyne biosynthesis protein [Actinomadura litoris]